MTVLDSFVLMNIDPGREDTTCAHRDVSVPHVAIGATARTTERIFASGNERTPIIFSNWGVKDAGYKQNAADKLGFTLELMKREHGR
jgi:hypothetical protein